LATKPAEADAPFVFEDTEAGHRVAHTARRVDYPAVDEALRGAEQRFRRELDSQLGADMVPALRAFQNARESGESDPSSKRPAAPP
jgi:hypothetical protein